MHKILPSLNQEFDTDELLNINLPEIISSTRSKNVKKYVKSQRVFKNKFKIKEKNKQKKLKAVKIQNLDVVKTQLNTRRNEKSQEKQPVKCHLGRKIKLSGRIETKKLEEEPYSLQHSPFQILREKKQKLLVEKKKRLKELKLKNKRRKTHKAKILSQREEHSNFRSQIIIEKTDETPDLRKNFRNSVSMIRNFNSSDGDFKITGILKNASSQHSIFNNSPDNKKKYSERAKSTKKVKFDKNTFVYKFTTVNFEDKIKNEIGDFKPSYFSPFSHEKRVSCGEII